MRRPLLLVLMLCAVTGLLAHPSRRSSKADIPSKGPEIRLTAVPRHGFRPVTLTLSGHLTGVDPSQQEFCHAGVEWESRTPTGLTVTSKEDPKCLHPPEQVDVQTVFTKVVTLSQPGIYVYRLILHRRDGERLLSNAQEIRILDNR